MAEIESNNDLENLFDSKEKTDMVALMYLGMRNDVSKLGKWLDAVRSRKIDDFEDAIADHYERICFNLKGDLNSTRKFMQKSYSCMNSKRKKIVIDEVNYGMD